MKNHQETSFFYLKIRTKLVINKPEINTTQKPSHKILGFGELTREVKHGINDMISRTEHDGRTASSIFSTA